MSAQGNIGFIGLGSQGGPMARRIVEAGFPTMLWARRAESLTPYADTAATYADSPAALAAACDIVCLCVVDDAGVRDMTAEMLPHMRSGAVLVIHSTVHPDTVRALASDAAAAGVDVLDAPVSGGGPGAAAGTLTVMAGGHDDVLARVRPVMESYAGLIAHLGDVGAGQAAKLVNNAMMAANMAVADAAFRAADALNIAPQALAELVKVSSGRSFGFEIRARMPDPMGWTHGAALLSKDVGLLSALLPDNDGASRLDAAAQPFLSPILAQDHGS